MEMNDFIIDILNHTQEAVTRAVDGLTREELAFQPDKECNSIGFLLWHQSRAEDSLINGMVQQKPQVWTSENWHQKMKVTENPEDDGWGYTAEQIVAFPVPELKDLLDYAEAVRSQTVEYLKAMTSADFDKVIKTPFGELTIGQMFSLTVCELNQHTGQIAYLRGLQRGLNK
jgi:hypothetical protein